MSEKLLPCPFCGETPQLKHAVGEYWPLCKCEVSGRSTSTEAGAIAAWNRRVPPPPDRGSERIATIKECAAWYDAYGWELDPMNVSSEMKRQLTSPNRTPAHPMTHTTRGGEGRG